MQNVLTAGFMAEKRFLEKQQDISRNTTAKVQKHSGLKIRGIKRTARCREQKNQ